MEYRCRICRSYIAPTSTREAHERTKWHAESEAKLNRYELRFDDGTVEFISAASTAEAVEARATRPQLPNGITDLTAVRAWIDRMAEPRISARTPTSIDGYDGPHYTFKAREIH